MLDQNIEKLALQIANGKRDPRALKDAISDRSERLTACAQAIAANHSRVVRGQTKCSACTEKKGSRYFEFLWEATLDAKIGQTIWLAIPLFPFVLIRKAILPIPIPSFQEPDIKKLMFKTIHVYCEDCAKRRKRGRGAGVVVQFFLGIPLVFSFGAFVFACITTLAAGFGLFGLDLRALAGAFAAVLVSGPLTFMIHRGLTRIPILLEVPKPIRNIGLGGFSPRLSREVAVHLDPEPDGAPNEDQPLARLNPRR